MKVAVIYGQDEVKDRDISMLSKLLDRYKIDSIIIDENNLTKIDKNINLLITVGGDHLILKALLYFSDKEVPILGLHGRRSEGFLYLASIDLFPKILNEVIKGNYVIEDRIRLALEMGVKKLPSALNEIAIFSKMSGRLIRYSLYINNEFIWRDDADGVIISTPTGSTAYALSAGGSIIRDADVFEIVPVNTLIPTHKPIITSCKNEIIINDLNPNENILIIDGQVRVNVETERIRLYLAKQRARFIKLKDSTVFNIDKRLVRRILPTAKTHAIEGLPPSVKLVYKVLEYEGPLTYKELIDKSGLPTRTARYALKILLDRGMIVKSYLNRDAKKTIYKLNL